MDWLNDVYIKYKIKRVVLYGIQNDTMRVKAIVFCSRNRKEPVAGVFVSLCMDASGRGESSRLH